jgi:hypothetical protein
MDVELQIDDAPRTSKRFSVIEVNDQVLKLKWSG